MRFRMLGALGGARYFAMNGEEDNDVISEPEFEVEESEFPDVKVESRKNKATMPRVKKWKKAPKEDIDALIKEAKDGDDRSEMVRSRLEVSLQSATHFARRKAKTAARTNGTEEWCRRQSHRQE